LHGCGEKAEQVCRGHGSANLHLNPWSLIKKGELAFAIRHMNRAIHPAEFSNANSSGLHNHLGGQIPCRYVSLTEQRLPLLHTTSPGYRQLRPLCIGTSYCGRPHLDQPADVTIV